VIENKTGIEQMGMIQTINGLLAPEQAGLTDAHEHVWIDPVTANSELPRLDHYAEIAAELRDYRSAGGCTLVDCQPAFTGRDGRRLSRLSVESGVNIIACTGFHLRSYYPENARLWSLTEEIAGDFFIAELTRSLVEFERDTPPHRAGVIKVALPAEPDVQTIALMRAAGRACLMTGAAIMIHTDRGLWAENILPFFGDLGIKENRLIICHIDKRPDYGLHAELAREGALLEYDTFLRPKYDPQKNVYPLIDRMVSDGFSRSVALALDIAYEKFWAFNGGPGLVSLPYEILSTLKQRGLPESAIRQMAGENIARRLAF
jgi:predicted metal-dependent phosphotriesterase family hydrolase